MCKISRPAGRTLGVSPGTEGCQGYIGQGAKIFRMAEPILRLWDIAAAISQQIVSKIVSQQFKYIMKRPRPARILDKTNTFFLARFRIHMKSAIIQRAVYVFIIAVVKVLPQCPTLRRKQQQDQPWDQRSEM